MHDLSTNETRKLTNELEVHHFNPAISGDIVVWGKDVGDKGDQIYMHDLSTNETKLIVNSSTFKWGIKLSGNKLVWYDILNNSDIYMYDLSTNEERRITNDSNNYLPSIDKNIIVWDRESGNGYDTDIYMFDLLTNEMRGISNNPSEDWGQSISMNRIVWNSGRTGGLDIYMFDLLTNELRRITYNPDSQHDPFISGNRIVWGDSRNGNSDIYMYDLLTNKETRITYGLSSQSPSSFSNNKIVWDDSRNGNYDIYMYELPEEPFCGDNVKDPSEECDGTDSDCPGMCDQTCICKKPQSKILNNNNQSVTGQLIIILQKNESGNWKDKQIFSQTGITIPANGLLKLDTGEDSNDNKVFPGWNNLNVSANEAGNYRIHTSFAITSNKIETNWEFEVR